MAARNQDKREQQAHQALCPECGSATLETVHVEETFDHGGRKKPIHLTASLPIKHCQACDFSFEDWETEEARHRAACAQVGVQAPDEIRSIRKASGLSQREFARLTRLGGATLNRWERGHLIQNGAYDDYLYLLRFPENLERLRGRRVLAESAIPIAGRQARMAWIYCATASQVDPTKTQALLRTYQGIWCPPPTFLPWPGTPRPGDQLWLVWRKAARAKQTFLLGAGHILSAPRHLYKSDLLWTSLDVPGIREEAFDLGYKVGDSAAFLRLSQPVLPPNGALPQAADLGPLHPGMNVASQDQERKLDSLLAIP
jgi:putative zinc finger/helix-turn-helix YgiT family protein